MGPAAGSTVVPPSCGGTAAGPPGAWAREVGTSVLVGTVAGVLVGAGDLDPNRLVTDYVPELASSGYAGATVRHLLDMRSGIKFSENYLDPKSEVRQIEESIGWSETNPEGQAKGMYEFLTTLEAKSEHGGGPVYPPSEAAGASSEHPPRAMASTETPAAAVNLIRVFMRRTVAAEAAR